MKKILIGVPYLAIFAGAAILVGQVANGSAVAAPTVPQTTARVAASATQTASEDPTVVMFNWQETARRTMGSKFKP